MIYLLWLFYLAGWLTVILDRAYKSAKNPLTPWDSIGDYFKRWFPGILRNFMISTAAFVAVAQTDFFLTQGLPFATGEFKTVAFPLVKSVLFGISSDKVADLLVSGGTFLTS